MHNKQCHELLTSLSEYIDGNLDHIMCDEIEKHMENCPNCKIVYNTLRKTIDLYHQVDENAPMPDDARQRLFARLDINALKRK